MIQVAMILPTVALTLLPVCFVVLYVKIQKIKLKMGQCELAFPGKSPYVYGVVFISTIALIAVNYIRKLEFLTVFAVCGVGVLGFYIGIKEFLYSCFAGMYTYGILWAGDYIFFTEIESYSLNERFTLTISTRDRGQKIIYLKDSQLICQIAEKIEAVINPLQ